MPFERAQRSTDTKEGTCTGAEVGTGTDAEVDTGTGATGIVANSTSHYLNKGKILELVGLNSNQWCK